MSNSLGHIKSVTLMLDDMMKLEKMDFNKLGLLVGKNGSGKTLVMKNVWCIEMISIYVICGLVAPAKSFDLKTEAQFIYDNTFDDCDFTGYVIGYYEDCELRIDFEKGQVVKLDHNFPNDLLPPSMPIYMSGQTRTFDTFIKYMKFKLSLGITNNIGTITTSEMSKILSVYKLYDVLFIEAQLLKLNGKVVSDDLKKRFKEEFEIKANIDQILVDTTACTMVNYERDTLKSTPLTRFSAGEQSLLNMMLAGG